MTPINFPESNVVLHKPDLMDEECGPLPIFQNDKHCISCWKPTWRERVSIIFHGRVWLSVRSVGGTQPPVSLRGYKTAFE